MNEWMEAVKTLQISDYKIHLKSRFIFAYFKQQALINCHSRGHLFKKIEKKSFGFSAVFFFFFSNHQPSSM